MKTKFFADEKYSLASNYRDAIIGIDNESLDNLIMKEFTGITEITGHAEYGIICEMHVDREACKHLIGYASHLAHLIDREASFIDVLNARKEFEHYLVVTYNSLAYIDLNNLQSWAKLQSPAQKLKFILGCILDYCYKNTPAAGKYKEILNKLDPTEHIPTVLTKLKKIFNDPPKYIAKYLYQKRVAKFKTLLFPYISGLRDKEPPKLNADAFNLLLEQYKDIHVLKLNQGYLHKGLQLLVDALSANKTISVLDLSCTYLKAEDIKPLGEWLKNNKTIKALNINGNKFGDLGLDYLLEGLINNDTLQSLQISFNGISETGIKKFAEFLKINTSLVTVTLSTSFREVELSALLEAVKMNKSLYYLTMDHPFEAHRKLYQVEIDGDLNEAEKAEFVQCKKLDKQIALVMEQNRQNLKMEQEKNQENSPIGVSLKM